MTIREKALEQLQEGPLDRRKLIPIIRNSLGSTDQGIRRTLQRMVHGGIIEKVTTPDKKVILRISQKVLGELEAENKALREQIDRFREELKRLELKRQYNLDSYKAKSIRFGLISDTHLGSKYENLPFLNLAYDIYEQEGIKRVYHCGDITEGRMRHRGHEFEIHVHGMDNQADYTAEQYPHKKGIITKFITGSHDLSFYKSVGGDIGKKITDLREDLIYLGQEQAQVLLEDKNGNTATLRLVHPGGGTAYSLSYKPQKQIESLSGGTKPNIEGIGHYHKLLWLPGYRNIQGFLVGSLQHQTAFMARHHNASMQGFLIVEVVLDENGIIRCRPEVFPGYEDEFNVFL
jgi:hypothetical protein